MAAFGVIRTHDILGPKSNDTMSLVLFVSNTSYFSAHSIPHNTRDEDIPTEIVLNI